MFTVVADLKEKFHGALNNQRGFTLVELLIVLAIMGALIAMLAPRMIGFADRGNAVAHSTSMERLLGTISGKVEHCPSKYPDGMINLISITSGAVDLDGAGPLPEIPAGTTLDPQTHGIYHGAVGVLKVDNDPFTGSEAFAADFIEYNRLALHTLNAAEANELIAAGISHVHNLNYDGKGGALNLEPPNKRVAVAEGVQVMMVGAGAPDAASNITQIATGGIMNYPQHLGRMVFGIGDSVDMVVWGQIVSAPEHPAMLGGEAGFVNYALILPRLKATAARDDGTVLGSLGIQRVDAAGNLLPGTERTITSALPVELGTGKENIMCARSMATINLLSPDGVKWPADGERWQIITP